MLHSCHSKLALIPQKTHSGINILGEIPWGSHFCEFYETEHDLLDVIILYFMEGLSNNECCLWASRDETEYRSVYTHLKKNIPGLDEMIEQEKMQFLTYEHLTDKNPLEKSKECIQKLIEKQQLALEKGFSGLRIASSPEKHSSQNEWELSLEHETLITNHLNNSRVIVLCCYALPHYDSFAVMDLIASHELSLIRRKNDWKILENSSLKMSKNQFSKINQELEQRVNERTETIAMALDSRDQFLAIVSHELKTPVTALRLYIDGLLLATHQDFSFSEKASTILKKTQEQSLGLELLINNLLDVTGFQKEGILPIHSSPMDLAKLVQFVVNLSNEKLNREKDLIILQAPDSLMGHWDSLRLTQVIKNLIENALKYSADQSVLVSLSQKNKKAILSVKDQGIGIAKENHKLIFDRFIQLANKNYTEGFGLGLWIVRQIVEAHKGKIIVVSEPGKGAEFIVSLPL